MAAHLRRLLSFNSDKNTDVVNSREIRAPLPNDYNNWSISRQNIESIYQIGTFDFKTAYFVKTHEETISILNEFQTIPLLNKSTIQNHLKHGYRFMHFGLIQIAVKPLVREGVNSPIYLALHDKRYKRYKSSLLAMDQTNICNGPIFFNCCPNFSVDLTDPMILDSLMFDVKLLGDEFFNCKNFVVIYRVYFRLMSSNLNPKFSNPFPLTREEIVLLQIDVEKPTTFTPKRLKWSEITIPSEFVIENPQPPRNIMRNEVEQIIEEPDGRVLLKFGFFREPKPKFEFPKT